jgi:hypothetical protein
MSYFRRALAMLALAIAAASATTTGTQPAWNGIDPAQLEQGHFNKGTGTVGRLPTGSDQRTAQ